MLAQHFVAGTFTWPSVLCRRLLHFHLGVRQLDAAGWRSVVADVPFAVPGVLLRASCPALNTRIRSSIDLVDHAFNRLAGILDQVDRGQDTPAVLQNGSMLAALWCAARVARW
jgi:hypothetical protein